MEVKEPFRETAHGVWVPADCEDERLPLALLNWHEQDALIHFRDRDHRYFHACATPAGTLQSSSAYVSVTGLYKKYCHEFNSNEQAKKMCGSHGFPNRHPRHAIYKQLLKNVPKNLWCETVLNEWERKRSTAAALGTKTHRELELLLNAPVWWEAPSSASKEVLLACVFLQRMKDKGWRPYRTEMLIDVPELKLAGSADFLLTRGNGELLLGDWKRAEKIDACSPFSSMKQPFNSFPDTNLFHYTMQTNLYKAMLEWHGRYGVRIVEMWLVVVHPNQDAPFAIKVEEQSEAAEYILQQRREFVSNLSN
jgi:hypothetical protein